VISCLYKIIIKVSLAFVRICITVATDWSQFKITQNFATTNDNFFWNESPLFGWWNKLRVQE